MDYSDCNSAYSQDTYSQLDEERMRTLFQSCDKNGDGYIDSVDLNTICKQLHLEHCLDELMQGLGADENGRISYDEFLKRRRALKAEIDALRNSIEPRNMPECHLSSSDTSAEAASGIWEYDSGTSDLSPEPNSLQRLVEAAGGSVTTGNAASLLHLANKLHLAALGSLHAQIAELTYKLATTTEERDQLQRKLVKMETFLNAELIKEQYEERITELHSIIAELKRKMSFRNNIMIEEEDLSETVQTCEEEFPEEFSIPGPSGNSGQDVKETEANAQMASNELMLKRNLSELTLNDSDSKDSLPEDELDLVEEMAPAPPMEPLLTEEVHLSERDRVHADNILLQLSLFRIKEENESLMLLVGQYESNVTALRLALNSSEQALEAYRKLEILLLNPADKRTQLQAQLRQQIDQLCKEKELISGTVIEFKSYSIESSVLPHVDPNLVASYDLEVAILVQELMRAREDRHQLINKLDNLEKEREHLQLQIYQMEGWQRELMVNQERDDGAKATESVLKEKLTKSLEKQVRLTLQLKGINAALMGSLVKCKRKTRSKIRELEKKLLLACQDHKNQVTELQQIIQKLELAQDSP